MVVEHSETHPTVVIAGNPNTGKSTVFNQLTGGRAKVGNYPGITVERSLGRLRLPGGQMASVYDSQGTNSLVARSPEEELSLESIAGLPPLPPADLVVVTVDASQLGRNLYLVLQIIELGVPVIVALNMIDTLEETGQEIHAGHTDGCAQRKRTRLADRGHRAGSERTRTRPAGLALAAG